MEVLNVKLYFDGSCDNNSKMKYMGIGVAVYFDDQYQPQWSYSGMVGTNGTNNIAEYEAYIKSLEILRDIVSTNAGESLLVNASIYGDSQLIVNQSNGEWRVRQAHLKSY